MDPSTTINTGLSSSEHLIRTSNYGARYPTTCTIDMDWKLSDGTWLAYGPVTHPIPQPPTSIPDHVHRAPGISNHEASTARPAQDATRLDTALEASGIPNRGLSTGQPVQDIPILDRPHEAYGISTRGPPEAALLTQDTFEAEEAPLGLASAKAQSTSNHKMPEAPSELAASDLDRTNLGQAPVEAHDNADEAANASPGNLHDPAEAIKESSVYQTRDHAVGATGFDRNKDRTEKGAKPRGRPRKLQVDKLPDQSLKPPVNQREAKTKVRPSKPRVTLPKRKAAAESKPRIDRGEGSDKKTDAPKEESWNAFFSRVSKSQNAYQPGEGKPLAAVLAKAGAEEWTPLGRHKATKCHCTTSKDGERILSHTCWVHSPDQVPLNAFRWPKNHSLQAGATARPGALYELLGHGRPATTTYDESNLEIGYSNQAHMTVGSAPERVSEGVHTPERDMEIDEPNGMGATEDIPPVGNSEENHEPESVPEVDSCGESSTAPPSPASSTPDFERKQCET